MALVIEVQNYNSTFSAIYTWILAEIIYDKRRVDPILFGVSSASLVDLRGTIGLVLGAAVPSLATLAHRLPSSTLVATNSNVLDRLRWRSTCTADLRLQYRRSPQQANDGRMDVSASIRYPRT